MNKLLASCIAITTVFLSGCGGMAPLVAMPEKPKDTTEVISTSIDFSGSKSPEVVQLKTHAVMQNSSVVINVPSSKKNRMKSRPTTQADDVDGNSPSKITSEKNFKTKDFFNLAEQEIEKVFISREFHVLSRAKFEAKLRDLRDEARCDWNCIRSQATPGEQTILDSLKSKLDRGEISQNVMEEQLQQYRDKMKTSSAGKSRNEDDEELTDISEVIRAAQSGETKADYILQINRFDTDKPYKITTDIRQNPKVREFVIKHPEIKSQLDNNNLLSCVIVGAELNAKLIHVKTGGIVWIGNFELNELNSELNQITIELGERTYVANDDSVKNFVSAQNSEFQRKANYKKEVKIPDWQFKTQLIPATVISGRCENQLRDDPDTIAKLAQEVAKGLISTIKVSTEQRTVTTEEPISDQNNIAQANTDLPNKSNKKTNTKKAN